MQLLKKPVSGRQILELASLGLNGEGQVKKPFHYRAILFPSLFRGVFLSVTSARFVSLLSILFLSIAYAGEHKPIKEDGPRENYILKVEAATGNRMFVASSVGVTQKAENSTERIKLGGGKYVPIFYELKLSKNDEVCRSLLSVVNKDLVSSPYIDYGNAEHFRQWELIRVKENVDISYTYPVTKMVVDIDNDGDQEHLYQIVYRVPIEKQWLVIFKNNPQTQLKITADPSDQFSAFSDFMRTEKETSNVAGEIQFFSLLRLSELPEYSDRSRIYFDGTAAVLNIYKHGGRHYLAADTRHYDPERSTRSYQDNPWYMLFSVSTDGRLSNTCIFKRVR